MSAATSISDFEYPSPEVIECPFPFYETLRETAPVHQLPTGEYMISRYEDLIHVARNPELFSSFIGPINPEIAGTYARDEGEESEGRFSPFPLPFSDPPEHALKRRLCLSIVSPDRLREYEEMIGGLVDGLIDAFIDDGHAEFCSQFAQLLPPSVILHIYGVPAEDQPMLLSWLAGHQGVGARMLPPAEKASFAERRAKGRAYFKELVLERHQHPRDDFLSDMVRLKHERDGDLDLSYLASEVTNLYGAATTTSAHMLASAMSTLLQHQDQLELVRSDHALIRPMLDEVLRLEAPVQWMQRIATSDTEIQGVEIPKGAVLLIVWASGNRDPERFENPDRFLVRRPHVARDQLSFGHGIHRCIGAALARLEGRVSYERLFTRLGEIRLAHGKNDFRHIEAFNHRAPSTLHIEFDRP